MSNIKTFPGVADPASKKPSKEFVKALKQLASLAESGEIHSFVGTGFTETGKRVTFWGGEHPNFYEMLGALELLKFEYQQQWESDFTELESPED